MEKKRAKSWIQVFIYTIFIGFLVIVFNISQNCSRKSDESEKSVSETTTSTETAGAKPKSSTSQETTFERKSRGMGITIGTPADEVLAIRGKALTVEVMGKDASGLIVEWEYSDGIYVMRRYEINGVICYRVAEMKL